MKNLESVKGLWYDINVKRNNRPQGVDLIKKNDKITTPVTWPKFRGWYSYA